MPLFNPSPLAALRQSNPSLTDALFPSSSLAPEEELPIHLQISFRNEVVAYGNKFESSVVQEPPTHVEFMGEPDKLYTLVMQDPDAPSPTSPTSRSFLHWIKPNLKTIDPEILLQLAQSGEDDPSTTTSCVEVPKDDLMPWLAPAPGKGTGIHRYVFILLEQPSNEVSCFPSDHPLRNSKPEGRRNFDIENSDLRPPHLIGDDQATQTKLNQTSSMAHNLKRKRPGATAPVVTEAPAMKFSNASEFRDALRDASSPEATKDILYGFRNQITVRYDEVVTATDSRVKLAHEYLEKSPGAPEVFGAWDLAISTNTPLLLPLPLSTLTAIIALLSPLSFFHSALTPILNKILSSTIMRAIAQYTAGTRADLIITALRALGETVKVADRWAAKVWEALANAGGINSKVWGKLLGMKRKAPLVEHGRSLPGGAGASNPLVKPDIRTLSINFLLSCLVSSHLPTKLAILNQSSVIHSMFKPIAEDHPLVVQRLLQGWWEVWFLEKRISRGTKASAFGVDVVGEILKLYETSPSPPSVNGEQNYSSRYLAHHFLISILTLPGAGLCFKDKGWYPRNFNMDATLDDFEEAGGERRNGGGVHNKAIKEILRVAGGLGLVGEDSEAEELVRRILTSCPELVAGYWSGSGITLDPRLSSKYLISSAHLSTIISLPIPVETFLAPVSSSSTPSTSASTQPPYRSIPPPLNSIVENILPSIFPKQFSAKGLVSSHPLVQQTTVVTLSRCLTKLQNVFNVFKEIEASLEEGVNGLWTARRKELEREIRKRVPDVATVVGCAVAATRTSGEAQGSEESTRASILTEAILRLLSLYQITLPGLIAEGKFDVGKLLVSGDGGKGKGKGEGEGDDDKEIEGWGFARSEVFGVEALSQLHVLRLLREGGDLAWGSKAGSSPHTYIYHLLALYLSTPHKTTRAYTSILITRLLSSSVLFEHDPSEVEVWLKAMQGVSRSASLNPTSLSEAQATLLTFLDDSIRRCLKTPYKYIEDSLEFIHVPMADRNQPPKDRKLSEAPSPLFMTVLEQLKAKINVKILSSSEAVIIGGYIRRLAFLMIGKQGDLDWSNETSYRLDTCLRDLEGEEKNAEVGLLKKQLTFLSTAGIFHYIAEQQEQKKLSTEAIFATHPMNLDPFHGNIWSNLPPQAALPAGTTFPVVFLHLPFDLLSDPAKTARALRFLPSHASVPLIRRACRLVLHRVKGVLRSPDNDPKAVVVSERMGIALAGCVNILKHLLSKCDRNDKTAYDALKLEVITDEAMKELFVSGFLPGTTRQALAILIASSLNPASEADRKIASSYLGWATLLLNSSEDIRNKWSVATAPWIRFLEADALVAIADRILGTIKSSGKLNPESALLLNVIFTALKRYPPSATVHAMAQRSLPILLPLGLVDSVAVLLKTSLLPGFEVASANDSMSIRDYALAVDAAAPQSFSALETSASRIPMDLKLFVGGISSEKAELITPLLYQAGSAREGFSAWLAQNLKALPALSLPVLAAPIAAFLDISSAEENYTSFAGWKACEESLPRLISTFLVISSFAGAAISANSRLALTECIYLLAACSKEAQPAVAATFSSMLNNPASFTSSVCELIVRFAKLRLPHLESIVAAYIDSGFERLVRQLSGDNEHSSAGLSFVTSFTELVTLQPKGNSLKGHLLEPFFTVALQDCMDTKEVLELVRVCTSRTNMKPAIVVRHLQILLANRSFNSLHLSETPAELRIAVIAVIRALFDMSPATCCQPAHIEPLMALYRGTMDRSDETILSIFHLFERHRRVSVASLLTCWSPDGPLAAGSIRRSLDIILALDPNRVLKTCSSFPMRRTFDLQPAASHPSKQVDPELYDPLYLLSIFAVLLHQSELGSGNELTGLEWVEILRSNILGLAVCALSSRMDDMRSFASFLISKACSYIHTTPFQEQSQILYTLHILQHSSRAPELENRIPHRSPPLISLFFAHTLRSIGNPSSFLYPLASRFLLQRSQLDTKDVPLLYGMLYSGDEEWKQERTWILRFIRDGMRSAEDWRILQRRRTFSLLASLFQSTHDIPSRRTILEVFANMTHNPTACVSLVKREGFLAWVHIQLGFTLMHQDILSSHAAGANGRAKKLVQKVEGLDEDNGTTLQMEEIWLRLLVNVVQRMGEDDVARAVASSSSSEEQRKLPKASWRGEVLALIFKLIGSSSSPQALFVASQVLLRLSLLPASQPSNPTVSKVNKELFSKLHLVEAGLAGKPSTVTAKGEEGELWTSEKILVPGGIKSGEAWSATVEAIWRVAMSLGVKTEQNPDGVETGIMERLSGRVMCTGGEIGSWIRREWVRSKVIGQSPE
ncbi:Uncharacterized conserved protein [Phaffia rhodozyma]|uniref:Uncharacterized conserved protein n=1 Tax=Phaffia rhodozyma TaxID=264483 RepID=A0A0F7SKE1_PHARH|nr:Uncharacterized conserved protein [Phaffia rhodozyma]